MQLLAVAMLLKLILAIIVPAIGPYLFFIATQGTARVGWLCLTAITAV
jgi:hypothetical protein